MGQMGRARWRRWPSIQLSGVRDPYAPLTYFDFARFGVAFLAGAGGVANSRFTTCSNRTGLRSRFLMPC